MSRLIDGVLSYSRVGTHARRPSSAWTPAAVVEEVIDSLGPLRGISVRIEGALPGVEFDRTQLTQIFQNLIQNGVQHIGRQSGEVVVSCREGAEEFEFSVRDDGVGIPESHFHRIFEMFYVRRPGRGHHGSRAGDREEDRRDARGLRLRGVRVGSGGGFPLHDPEAAALRARAAARCGRGGRQARGKMEVLRNLFRPGLHAARPLLPLAAGQEEDRRHAYELGAAGYLVKPIEFDRFAEVVGAIDRYWTLCETP